MAATKKRKRKSSKNTPEPAAKHFPVMGFIFGNPVSLIIAFSSIIFLLALITYVPEDYHHLSADDNPMYWVSHNWFGPLGIYLSHFSFLFFGIGAYILGLTMLTSGIRHICNRELSYHYEYFISFLLIPLGLSLFFATFPDSYINPAVQEGSQSLAGGILGQRFCAPKTSDFDGGWLSMVISVNGCRIISLFIALIGFGIIWFNDWHASFKIWLKEGIKSIYRYITTPSEPKPAKEKKEVEPEIVHATIVKEEKNEKEGGFFSGLTSRKKEEPTLFDTTETFAEPSPTPPIPAQIPPPKSEVTPLPMDDIKMARPHNENTSRGKSITMKLNNGTYTLPSLPMLNPSSSQGTGANQEEIARKKLILQQTLESFKIDARVTEVTAGPRVTLFEIVTAPGVNLKKITSLTANITMDLKAHSLRILAPIPGKNSVGIEVPNEKAVPVGLRGLLEADGFQKGGMQIPLSLGRDIAGEPVFLDLAKAPHLLIAGATGSGKSVCMNTIIASMLFRFSPEDLRLILVDPKVVEFKNYEKLPHLVTPVVNDPMKVTMALHWAVKEMEHRYKLLAHVGVKNLESFNNRKRKQGVELDHEGNPVPDRMPFLVIIIDELADIMMTAKGDVETSLARIAQLGRASGIHAIIATQRPSVNVITGIIKANFPTRIAFKVTSAVDSRTILDQKGADQLLGMGDMLFNPPGASTLLRIQGAYVQEEELEKVVDFVSNQIEQCFDDTVFASAEDASNGDMEFDDMEPSPGFTDADMADADEELLQEAIKCIIRDNRASTSYIQRCLRIGYNRAATLMDKLEERGVVGPQYGSSKREILINTQTK